MEKMEDEIEIKKVLEDAGMYESNMTKSEMMDCYKAINKSRDTVEIEEATNKAQKISINNNDLESVMAENEEKSSKVARKTKPLDTNKTGSFDNITFQDMIDAPKSTLDIIYHKPKYGLPIATNPVYQNLSIEIRTKLLFNYHTNVCYTRTNLARKSLYAAPQPKPISSSIKCTDDLRKDHSKESLVFDFEQDQFTEEDVYVSQKGRCIKRKRITYAEDSGTDSDYSLSAFPKPNKTLFLDMPSDSSTKITLDTPLINVIASPKSRKVTKKGWKKTRAESMFDKLKEAEEQEKLNDVKMKSFDDSLPNSDKEEEDLFQEQEKPFARKRVVPPLYTKKNVNKKRIVKENLDKIEVVTSPSKHNTRQKRKSDDKFDCPICGKLFLEAEIEEHASNCGDFNSIINNPNHSTIKCDKCDKVLINKSDLEDHVDKCIESSSTQ